MRPDVSILLPVHNGGTALRAALESLLRQTVSSIEVVAVENGSSDDSAQYLAAAAARDPRVRLLRRQEACLVGALNYGLEHCRGRYLARMDSDDVSHPQRIELQLRLLERSPEAGVAACGVEFGGSRSSSGGYARIVDWVNSLGTHEEMLLNRFVESPVAHPSVMLRSELLRSCGAWRLGDFPEDYELWLRLFEQGVRFEKVRQVLLRWNDPPQRLSRTDSRYSTQAFYRLKAGYLAEFLKRSLSNRELYVWGAGRETRRRAELLCEFGVEIAGWVDIDPKKINRMVADRPVISAAQLPAPGRCFVVPYVARWGAREEISTELEQRGFKCGRDYISAA